MNKPITLKITLALFFVIICRFIVQAQDTTNKMILVVRPGQNTSPAYNTPPANITVATPAPMVTIVPVMAAIYTPASTKAKAPGKGTNTNGKNTIANPANAAGAALVKTAANTASLKPVSVTPAVAVAVKPPAPAYMAPTTSERTGTATYMQRSVPPKRTPATTAVVPVSTAPANTVNKVNAPAVNTVPAPVNTNATGAATTAAIVPTVGAVPVKKDTIVKKDTVTKRDTIAKADTSAVDSTNFGKNRIVFLELGGPGLAISANYDMRINSNGKKDGFGFRAGAGYFQSGNNWVFTVPLQANYLYGKDGKYFEFGLGTTFLISRGDNYSSKNFIFDNDTGFIGTATIGFRYEPSNTRINFRLGYVPIIDSDGFVNAGGFSVGYTF